MEANLGTNPPLGSSPGSEEIPLSLLSSDRQYNLSVTTPRTRVFVDVTTLVIRDNGTGIERVQKRLLLELKKIVQGDFDFFAVFTKKDQTYYSENYVVQDKNHQYRKVQFIPGDIFFDIDLPLGPQFLSNEFVKNLKDKGVVTLFLLYDILPLKYPQFFNTESVREFGNWLRKLVVADHVLCISHAVASDLGLWLKEEKYLEADFPLISTIHLGSDFLADQHPLERTGLSIAEMTDSEMTVLNVFNERPTFLMVGTIEPRKGHSQALDAFDYLTSSGVDLNLVIVGRQGWYVDEIVARLEGHPHSGVNLFWMKHATDKFLQEAYKNASALIAASIDEGFGLPLIEAAQHELPVLCRDIPVFREIMGKHAQYFSGAGATDLGNAISEWMELKKQNMHPTTTGLTYSTWSQYAQNVFELLKRVARPMPLEFHHALFEVSHFPSQFKWRLGIAGDGGYVITQTVGEYDCYISAGISDEESFSRDFLKEFHINSFDCYAFDGTIDKYPFEYTTNIMFIKKNIGSHNDDHTTNLSYLLGNYEDIFLKMDIEGGEYLWLSTVEEEELGNIAQMVIEFHGINDDSWGTPFADKIACFVKLLRNHVIVHAHANNEGGTKDGFPDILELTLINKRAYDPGSRKNSVPLPISGLDFRNNQFKNEIELNFYPFVTQEI